ncbi:putative DNA-binding transcriptional regulator YafY [Arcicella aurantiaca]|uniref:Putative DNA-binding transcriptional regulator YafY n=1 Tax=Arcicella aurantiaca TaxID=591202 RepID=A0A316DFI1_9BACT|nr:WYL domain-containing protein [Arcicella aurantiaca]PWK16961.1 putative DNA-binding transcriptional regulator YafY [Arcicella aurantiaca]
MAKTKNQFNRLEILHNLLVKGSPVGWTDIEKSYLLNGIKVSKKTIFNDLQNLEEIYKAPIKHEKGKYSYKEVYSFQKMFSVDDSKFAEELQTLLQQFAEFPVFKGLEDIWLKLKERIPNAPKEHIVQFESNNDYSGLKRINELYEAIKNKKCLKIKYQDFDKELREYSISPYLLKEYHNRWHIYGYEFKKEKIYNLALDRILAIEDSSLRFRQQTSSDLAFLEDIVGFTYLYNHRTGKYAQLETVKLKVESKRANYLKTKPLHHSQKEIESENIETHKIFEYRLRINNELIAKILEFGKDAEVLEPVSLREEIVENIREMAEGYGISNKIS